MVGLAHIAQARGDLDAAEALHREALELARAVGDRQSIATSLQELASVILWRGEPDRAQPLAAEGLAIAREIADRWVLISNLGTTALIAEDQQDFPRAAGLHAEALEIAVEMDDERLVAHYLEGIARCAIGAGEAAPAVRLLGAAETLWEKQSSHTPQWGHPRETARPGRAVDQARQVLGEELFDASLGAGRVLTRDDAATKALALAAALRGAAG